MNWRYVKKAVVAGAVAAGGALVGAVVHGMPTTEDGWLATVAAALGVGITAALAVYKTRNAGLPPGGSERA